MQNCYNTGRIPRENMNDQQERLTTKHIHTLQFLQETVKENKELKARVEELEAKLACCADLHQLAESSQERIKEIQTQYLKRADEINAILIEKNQAEVMKKVQEQLEAEKQWAAEKDQLRMEIEQLRKENCELRQSGNELQQERGQLEILQLKVDALQQELDRVEMENAQLDEVGQNRLAEIRRLEFVDDQNKHLKDELTSATQRVKELEFKVSRLERDLGEVGVAEQEELMTSLKVKLAKLLKEKGTLVATEKTHLDQIQALEHEVAHLRRALDDSERMRGESRSQVEALERELELLRRTRQQAGGGGDVKQNFRDFVQLKRDFLALAEEHEQLKVKLMFAHGGGSGRKSPALLSLRADGSEGQSQGQGQQHRITRRGRRSKDATEVKVIPLTS